jgi:hypothetical protein
MFEFGGGIFPTSLLVPPHAHSTPFAASATLFPPPATAIVNLVPGGSTLHCP